MKTIQKASLSVALVGVVFALSIQITIIALHFSGNDELIKMLF